MCDDPGMFFRYFFFTCLLCSIFALLELSILLGIEREVRILIELQCSYYFFFWEELSNN